MKGRKEPERKQAVIERERVRPKKQVRDIIYGVCGCVKKRTKSGNTNLSQLVVDHHIVGFYVTVHDAHTVTVVQSLAGTHTHTKPRDEHVSINVPRTKTDLLNLPLKKGGEYTCNSCM